MVRPTARSTNWPLLLLALAALPATAAMPTAEATPPPTPEQAWRAECSACHVPYPARLLPAAGWQSVMETLPRHFGVDASLDAQSAQVIHQYLVSHAGPARAGKAGQADARRITELEWFVREHRGARWPAPPPGAQGAAKRSFANCEACHQGAAAGRFEEDEEGERGEGRHHHGGRDDG